MSHTRRIGLFGGTFDPPHNAHLALARAALAALQLDELRWVPAGQPWQKSRNITAAVHREAMVRLALAGEPRFVLERCELQRAGPSYMVDTVRELQQQTPGASWFLLIGADQYESLHTWHQWRDLLALVTLAVAPRPGSRVVGNEALQGVALKAVPLPPMADSATQIRARAAQGLGISHLVPAAVAGYIDQQGLYLPAEAPFFNGPENGPNRS